MLKRFWKRLHTLRFSLPLIVMVCWLLPTLALGVLMGTRVFDTLRAKTESALRAGAEYARSAAVRNVEGIQKLARDVVYDNELALAAQDHEAGVIPYETYYKLVRGYLDRKFVREESCAFALFFRSSDPSRVIYTSQGYSAAVLFQQRAMADVIRLCDTLDTRSRFVTDGERAYLVRNLHNARIERFGVLVIGLRMERVLEPLFQSALDWDGDCAVRLDDYASGTFLGAEDVPLLCEYGDKLCCTLSAAVEDASLRFQVQADRRLVYREMDAFRALLGWLLLLVAPVGVGVTVFVSRRIVRPIALLSTASERIRGGELGVVVPMHGNDELGRLGVAFSDMSLRLKELIERSYKEEIALRDARIQAMQSRINPHFLNNALEAVNWQARLNGDESVSEMVETLSVLLNASLDRSERHLVPLREELHIADAYLYFVGLQFGKRLTVTREVDAALMDTLVPRLVVQTLLENAVEHGVALASGGTIALRAFRREQSLVVQVANDGKPLGREELERIRAMLEEKDAADGRVGIRNVNQRLRLIFGEAAGLSFDVDERGNTVAEIRQPMEGAMVQ